MIATVAEKPGWHAPDEGPATTRVYRQLVEDFPDLAGEMRYLARSFRDTAERATLNWGGFRNWCAGERAYRLRRGPAPPPTNGHGPAPPGTAPPTRRRSVKPQELLDAARRLDTR